MTFPLIRDSSIDSSRASLKICAWSGRGDEPVDIPDIRSFMPSYHSRCHASVKAYKLAMELALVRSNQQDPEARWMTLYDAERAFAVRIGLHQWGEHNVSQDC